MLLQKWGRALVVGLVAIGALVAQPARAAVTFVPGDVFVGTTAGNIQHRSSSGTLLETLNTTEGNQYDTGMCFDLNGNLYATDIYGEAITKFNHMGNLVAVKWVDTSSDGNNPESCVWDAANANAFVGGPFVPQIRQYSLAGTELARNTVASSGGTGGTDWVDLSSDQCTIYYTDEGNTIRRFDTCTHTQLTDFATISGGCYALRIRPTTMEVMVACSDGVHLLSSTGTIEQTYHPAAGALFALNLDPDGKSFWTAPPGGTEVFKVDIATGAVPLTFSTGAAVWGLAVFGELTAASTMVTTSLSGGGQSGAQITVAAGTAVTDSATLGGTNSATAGGTVTYNVYSDNQCTVSVASGGAKPVTNGVVLNSDSVTLTTAGTYYWLASYGGDSNNTPSNSGCGAETETVSSAKASPTITTSATGVVVGGTISDTAMLSGGAAPTGSITFNLFGPNDATCTLLAFTSTNTAVSGNGSYSSGSFTPLSPGTYLWVATYGGDTNNNSAMTACGASGETSTVTKASPTITTSATGVVVGGTISDTATLSGGTAPTGSVTFNLFGPNNPSCTLLAFTSTRTVSGNGPYTSAPFTPLSPGTYLWVATYSGDPNNNSANTACGASGETSTVTVTFAPGGGSFVIGDNNAVVGNSVTFWGAQWAKDNSLSGGSAPRNFKGFAENPATPSLTCGASWSADPGNSTPPPDGPLPAYMAVIVTSSADQSGSTDSGTIVHIVIVKTDPGYAPNPGHAGTGTVVAVVC